MLCSRFEALSDVVKRCSRRLDLDKPKDKATGKLIHQGESEATGVINNLEELMPGQMHHVTLVMSSP